MITLHKTTDMIKNLVKWGGVLAGTVIVVIILFNVGKTIWLMLNPPQKPPPEVCFGKLPEINFPEQSTNYTLTYTIDTLTGKLPVTDDRVNVYEMIQPETSLTAYKKTKEKVAKIGFKSDGIALSDTLYTWENTVPPFKKIDIDVTRLNFKMTSKFIEDPDVLAANYLSQLNAIEIAEAFLFNMSSLPEDVDKTKTKTTLFSINGSEIIPATSLSSAKLIRVDFYHKDVNKLPVYYSNSPYSPIYVIAASGELEGQVVEANFVSNKVGEKSCTYPIKTFDKAFSELKEKKGYIVSAPGGTETILIKNAFLAYYIENQTQSYLVPIIVFEGNNGFYAYINAISDNWIN